MPCDNDNWHSLWQAFDKHTTETIRVPRVALSDVIQCARERSETTDGIVAREPRADGTTVEVHRAPLFQMLRKHNCWSVARIASSASLTKSIEYRNTKLANYGSVPRRDG